MAGGVWRTCIWRSLCCISFALYPLSFAVFELQGLMVKQAGAALALTRYCYSQYCVLNGKRGGAGGNHILRNIDCNTQRGGGAIKEVLNAKNCIGSCAGRRWAAATSSAVGSVGAISTGVLEPHPSAAGLAGDVGVLCDLRFARNLFWGGRPQNRFRGLTRQFRKSKFRHRFGPIRIPTVR